MSGNDDLLAALRTAGGQSAQAEVTHTKRGKAVKGDPDQILWKVTLRVRPDHGAAFSVDVQTPYAKRDGGPSLGSRIGVVYDPKNHSKIAVDPNAPVESWGQAQADTMNRIVAQASGGKAGAVFVGGQWVSGPGAAAGASTAAASGATVAQQLEQLTALKDKGALTDVEFQAAKQRLLGG